MTVWTDHVKKFAKINQLSYGCAISDPRCKASYKNVVPKQAARSAMTKSAAKAGRDLIRKKENEVPAMASGNTGSSASAEYLSTRRAFSVKRKKENKQPEVVSFRIKKKK